MGVRYRNEFTSNGGIEWKIDIHDSVFGGSVSTFKTASPGFSMPQPSEGSQREDPIKGTSVAIHGDSEDGNFNTLISDIRGAQEERFSVALYKNATLYWAGHILTDIIEEEDAPQPFQIDITATDSLKRLKQIDYDNSGTLYTGFETFVGYIINILGKTNLSQFWGVNDEFLRVAVDWWDNNHPAPATAKDPFLLTRVQNEVFYLKDDNDDDIANNAFDVLDQILRAWFCRLTLSQGVWQIIQIPQYAGITMETRSYKKSGAAHSTTVTDYRKTVDQISIAKLATGIGTFFPALNRVEQIYNHRESSFNLLPNSIINNTDYNIGTVQAGAGNRLNFFGNIHIKHTQASGDPTKWFVKVSIEMELQPATKQYLRGIGTNDGLDWTTTISVVTAWLGPFSVVDIGDTLDFYRTIAFITPDIPVTDELIFNIKKVDFYDYDLTTVNTGDFTAVPTLTYEKMNITFIDGGGLKEKDKFVIENNTGSSPTTSKFIIELPETLIGDGPTGMSKGHLEANDGIGTWVDATAWDKNGNADNLNFNNLKIQEILNGQKISREIMQAEIFGDFDAVSRLTYDSKSWVFGGGTFRAEMDVWQGEWFEIGRDATNQNILPKKNILDDIQNRPTIGQIYRKLTQLHYDRFNRVDGVITGGTIGGAMITAGKIGDGGDAVQIDFNNAVVITPQLELTPNVANVDNPPTAAQLDAIFTSKAAFGNARVALLQDSDSDNIYIISTDLIKWYSIAGVAVV